MPYQLQLTFSQAGRLAPRYKTAASPRRAIRSRAKHTAVACSACKPVTTLPNGLQVCYASKYDVSFLYREIFQEQVYLQHGVQLAQGDVVVDVGGNIGFFALFAAQQVGPSGKVISLEPIPPLHNKLLFNVRSHHAWCQAQGDCKHYVAKNRDIRHRFHVSGQGLSADSNQCDRQSTHRWGRSHDCCDVQAHQ